MAEVKFLLYSDPDFMLVKSIRMQVFMSEQNIKGEEEFDELIKEHFLPCFMMARVLWQPPELRKYRSQTGLK